MLDQRRKRWADVGQMLYICFVLTGHLLFDFKAQNINLYKARHILLENFETGMNKNDTTFKMNSMVMILDGIII